jgi:hypothetical protein
MTTKQAGEFPATGPAADVNPERAKSVEQVMTEILFSSEGTHPLKEDFREPAERGTITVHEAAPGPRDDQEDRHPDRPLTCSRSTAPRRPNALVTRTDRLGAGRR